MTDLLDCPFCGGKASHVPTSRIVECVKCTAGFYCDTDAEAIAKWNRRAPTPSVPHLGTINDPLRDPLGR